MTADEVKQELDKHDQHCRERMKAIHAKLDRLTHLVYIGYGVAIVGYTVLLAFGDRLFS